MGFRNFGFATVLTATTVCLMAPVSAQSLLEPLLSRAVSENSVESAQAIASLRAQGPSGLQSFLDTHTKTLKPGTLPDPKLRASLDALCQQRDCHASRLFWYTDFEQAKAAARASGKPILSLRLLGRLDQELSCANSRFFRIALYPNAEVSQVLRDRFILHWQSVRPVPKISIDFGDGRTLERTLTGNSIHYILDAEGRPIEALPGLYGPQAFLRELQRAEQVVQKSNQLAPTERNAFLSQYHRDRVVELQTAWAADLQKVGVATVPTLKPVPNLTDEPTAENAMEIAVSKAIVENPILSSITMRVQENRKALETITDEATWLKIAVLHAEDAQLDRNSIALMRSKNSKAYGSTSSILPVANSDPFATVLQKFQTYMAVDTVRNQYLLHSQIHQWLVNDRVSRNLEALNESVYSSLFLTPSSDPWLGLLPKDVYTAIENDGLVQ